MWFLSDEGIDKKLGYLNSIYDLDNPERITYLLRFKHEELHEWIQLLREQEGEEPKLKEVTEKAQLLADFIIKNPKYAKDLIWVIRDLLGHNPLLFSTIDLSEENIQFLLKAVNSLKYENYPYVILVRYIQPHAREQFVYPVIKYADQLNNEMAWAMTGEACETLAFLNCHKEDSMKCLAKHLNDGGCDGYPADSIIKSIHVFKQYGNLAIDELLKYIPSGLDGIGDAIWFYEHLSKFIYEPIVAKKLLPAMTDTLDIKEMLKEIAENDIFDEDDHLYKLYRRELMFYGQLQAIIHGDI